MDIKKTYPLVMKDVAEICNNDSPSLLHAVLEQHPQLVELNDENGRTLLHHAAEAGSYGCVDLLIKNGSNIEATDVLGETPLHRALARGRRVATHVLLEAGANPNAKNFFGTTPSMYAALAGPDHFHILAHRGVDMEVKDNLGKGIAEWAAEGKWNYEQQEQVKRLKP